MCAKAPGNQQEMLDVSGVGENKFYKYGQRFLGAIGEFMSDNSDAVLSIEQEEAYRQEEKRVNAGQAWAEDEDRRLTEEFEAGMKIAEIARVHGRTNGAIRARLKRQGLIE